MLTPHMIQTLDSGEKAMEAKNILSHMKATLDPNPLKPKYFRLVQAYIIGQLMVSSAQRSGALRNMTVTDLINASEVKGRKVVSILKHKTSLQGPATVSISKALWSNLKVFIGKIRPPMHGIGPTHRMPRLATVFCTFEGKQMSSSTFSKQVKQEFGVPITATITRKTMVTTMVKKHPEKRSQTAHVMSHSMKMQSEVYNMTSIEESSASVADLMEKEIRGIESGPDKETTPEEEKSPKAFTVDLKVMPEEIRDAGSCFSSTSSHGRRSFSTTDSELISKIFKKAIKKGEAPVQLHIKERLDKGTHEEKKLIKSFTAKQVYDKIRAFIRKH